VFKSVKYYLGELVKDGHKWQHINVKGENVPPIFLGFSKIQLFVIFISILCSYFLSNGFNKDFIGYVMASLSVFIGLFLSLILTMFDKFKQVDFAPNNPSYSDIQYLKKTKNFFKQFTALTSYSIIISILCIILLGFSLAGEFFNTVTTKISFISSFEEMKKENILLCCVYSINYLYRAVVIYFLLDFLLLVLFAISSSYKYISIEYDKQKIKQN